jgi:hypothetical protein
MPYCLGMQSAPDDIWELYKPEEHLSWWAEYRGVILTALATTVIIVGSIVGVRRGWLP